METLTPEEALKQGYKFCGTEDGALYPLDGELLFNKHEQVFISEKEPYKFTIKKDHVKEMLVGYIQRQEEVADEGELEDCLTEDVLRSITGLINSAFAKLIYYDLTDIQLIISPININHEKSNSTTHSKV